MTSPTPKPEATPISLVEYYATHPEYAPLPFSQLYEDYAKYLATFNQPQPESVLQQVDDTGFRSHQNTEGVAEQQIVPVPQQSDPVAAATTEAPFSLIQVVNQLHIIDGPNGLCRCGMDGKSCSQILAPLSSDIRDAQIAAALGGTAMKLPETEPHPLPGGLRRDWPVGEQGADESTFDFLKRQKDAILAKSPPSPAPAGPTPEPREAMRMGAGDLTDKERAPATYCSICNWPISIEGQCLNFSCANHQIPTITHKETIEGSAVFNELIHERDALLTKLADALRQRDEARKEVEGLKEQRDLWEKDACRYAGNSDDWHAKFDSSQFALSSLQSQATRDAEEIGRLESVLDAGKGQSAVSIQQAEIDRLTSERDAAAARVAELEEDKADLDWLELEAKAAGELGQRLQITGMAGCYFVIAAFGAHPARKDLRSAVRAARALLTAPPETTEGKAE